MWGEIKVQIRYASYFDVRARDPRTPRGSPLEKKILGGSVCSTMTGQTGGKRGAVPRESVDNNGSRCIWKEGLSVLQLMKMTNPSYTTGK